MGGKVMESEQQFHNYGISITGCMDGVTFTEEFKKNNTEIFWILQVWIRGKINISIDWKLHFIN